MQVSVIASQLRVKLLYTNEQKKYYALLAITGLPANIFNRHTCNSSRAGEPGWILPGTRRHDKSPMPLLANVSFLDLPDWMKIFYVSAMATALVVLIKAVPFVLGKIDDLLKNENRHNILNYIYSNPGATVAEVAHAQSIERGTVTYHLYKLETEGKIVLTRIGKYSRIFRNSNTYSDFDKIVIAHLQNQTSRSVLLLVTRAAGHHQPGDGRAAGYREERHPLARGQIPARRPHQLPPGREVQAVLHRRQFPAYSRKVHGPSHLSFRGRPGPLLYTGTRTGSRLPVPSHLNVCCSFSMAVSYGRKVCLFSDRSYSGCDMHDTIDEGMSVARGQPEEM